MKRCNGCASLSQCESSMVPRRHLRQLMFLALCANSAEETAGLIRSLHRPLLNHPGFDPERAVGVLRTTMHTCPYRTVFNLPGESQRVLGMFF